MVTVIQNNREMIRIVAERLGSLRDQLVFLGGAATAFLITDIAAPDVRFTDDVDVIVEIGALKDYYALSELLRDRGFSEAMEEETVDGIKVDFLPPEKSISDSAAAGICPPDETRHIISGLHSADNYQLLAISLSATSLLCGCGGQGTEGQTGSWGWG